ncbi:MAG: hypothetical protein R2752_10920 [Vicinamibacterales bacterium]
MRTRVRPAPAPRTRVRRRRRRGRGFARSAPWRELAPRSPAWRPPIGRGRRRTGGELLQPLFERDEPVVVLPADRVELGAQLREFLAHRLDAGRRRDAGRDRRGGGRHDG